jgi:hypothetical protein
MARDNSVNDPEADTNRLRRRTVRVKPVSDEDIETLRAEMREQRAEIRADLEAAGVDVSNWGDSNHTDDARAEGDAANE